ncbi:MAG: type II toxin-antitoxin system Phd/YefM family antitoxin, partial [Nitrospirae bacterium]
MDRILHQLCLARWKLSELDCSQRGAIQPDNFHRARHIGVSMQVLSIGELKSHFSAVLAQVKNGETVVVSYGRNKEKVAAIVPYSQVMP